MPALTITNQGAAAPGTLLTFGGAGLDGQDQSVSSFHPSSTFAPGHTPGPDAGFADLSASHCSAT